MMKKNIAIVMMLLLSAIGAMAQGVENPVGRFSVIPRIGVAIANLSDNSIYLATENGREVKSKYQTGFLGGLDVEYRATDYLGVSLGACYVRQGARWFWRRAHHLLRYRSLLRARAADRQGRIVRSQLCSSQDDGHREPGYDSLCSQLRRHFECYFTPWQG